MIFAIIIFWICVCAIVHTYIGYPIILQIIIQIKGKIHFSAFKKNDNLPTISILMAAYNEELVIAKKIESIFNTSYPISKIELLIGSDNSSDQTNSIIENYGLKYPQIKFTPFFQRYGKVAIINQLKVKSTGEILFITDANVLFDRETLFETVKYFNDPQVGLVDTHMTNYGLKKDGISLQEKSYISREVYIKQLESNAFGTMIGPFGGCYAIRTELFVNVPENYLVDDFFICMQVLSQGKKAINNLSAIVYEDVPNLLSIEFKRKIRIATGNFQNLLHFKRLLCPPHNKIAFCFMSHKVLRWFGPFFIIGALVSNFFLLNVSSFYQLTLVVQLCITFLPIADIILKKFRIHIVFLRFATHFYTMNLSLSIGFIKSLKGVKTNVWKPTKRFQE